MVLFHGLRLPSTLKVDESKVTEAAQRPSSNQRLVQADSAALTYQGSRRSCNKQRSSSWS